MENIIFNYLTLKDEIANKKNFYIKTKTKTKTKNKIKKDKKGQPITNWTTIKDTRYITGRGHGDTSNNTMKKHF